MASVDQLEVEPSFPEHVPGRLPVRARSFHHHLGHAFGGEPVGHRLELGRERTERPGLFVTPLAVRARSAYTGHYLVFADVHTGTAFHHQVHHRPPRSVNSVWAGRRGQPISESVKRARDNNSWCREDPWLQSLYRVRAHQERTSSARPSTILIHRGASRQGGMGVSIEEMPGGLPSRAQLARRAKRSWSGAKRRRFSASRALWSL